MSEPVAYTYRLHFDQGWPVNVELLLAPDTVAQGRELGALRAAVREYFPMFSRSLVSIDRRAPGGEWIRDYRWPLPAPLAVGAAHDGGIPAEPVYIRTWPR